MHENDLEEEATRKVTQLQRCSTSNQNLAADSLVRVDQATALRCIEWAYPCGQKTGLRLNPADQLICRFPTNSCLECSNSDLGCFKTAVFVDVTSRFDEASVGSGDRLWKCFAVVCVKFSKREIW